jgi:hypothetical protein
MMMLPVNFPIFLGSLAKGNIERHPMKKILFVALTSIMLVSCSHDLTLVGRDKGEKGAGVATGWNGSGTLTVQLNRKTYTGDWVAASGGSVGSFAGFAGKTPVYTSGVAESGSSTGTALLSSEDGSRLHCEFLFGSFSNTGYGICEDDKKKIYDLQIH